MDNMPQKENDIRIFADISVIYDIIPVMVVMVTLMPIDFTLTKLFPGSL